MFHINNLVTCFICFPFWFCCRLRLLWIIVLCEVLQILWDCLIYTFSRWQHWKKNQIKVKEKKLTDINWYEWFIIAMSKLSSTTIFMTEYVPNISIPQKRVKILMPSNSKLSRSTRPKTAQKSVCVVSNKLHLYEYKKKWKQNSRMRMKMMCQISNLTRIRFYFSYFFFLSSFPYCKMERDKIIDIFCAYSDHFSLAFALEISFDKNETEFTIFYSYIFFGYNDGFSISL